MTFSNNPQQSQSNGSRIALWRQQPGSPNAPVASGTVRLSVPMLRDLLARAQAQQFSGNDERSGPYIELRWSGFQVSTQNTKAPQMSGPIETVAESEARIAAARAASGGGGWGAAPAAAPPAAAPAWGAPPAAAAPAAAPAWGAPPAAAAPAAPAAAPAWGAPPPAAAPPAAAPAGGSWQPPF